LASGKSFGARLIRRPFTLDDCAGAAADVLDHLGIGSRSTGSATPKAGTSASASPPIWIGAAACSRSAPGSHALGADRRQIRLLAVLSRIAVPGPVVKPLGLALG
jgi:hypothetical protein